MSVNPKLRFEVFKRDNFACRYCGRKTPEVILEVDHVIPVCEGGEDASENLVTSCFECNRGKGGTLLDTILKDKDVHTETVLLAEKELQLAEYNEIRKRIRKREDSELQILEDHFAEQFTYTGHARSSFPSNIVRFGLKHMSYIDIMDYIDYAISKTERDTRGEYHNVAAAKYLGGILRNKIKESGEEA